MDSHYFAPTSLVKMHNGIMKKIIDIQKNDLVQTPVGYGKVLAKVIYKSSFNCEEMIKLPSGLISSPLQPILINDLKNTWEYALNLKGAEKILYETNEGVVSLVLDISHIIYVDKMKVCTLGHNMKMNNIHPDPYFGSTKVILDLLKHKSWSTGTIIYKDIDYNLDRFGNCISIKSYF